MAGPAWEDGEEEIVRGGYTPHVEDCIKRSVASDSCFLDALKPVFLRPEHSPELVHNNQLSRIKELAASANPLHGDKPAPLELWMLYQDCFFVTPGLMNVFAEFTSHTQKRFGES